MVLLMHSTTQGLDAELFFLMEQSLGKQGKGDATAILAGLKTTL